MLFRNLTFLRIDPETLALFDRPGFADAFLNHTPPPATSFSTATRGWVPFKADTEQLTYTAGLEAVGFALGGEDRVLPPAAINHETGKRIKAIESANGTPVGRAHRVEIKNAVITELVARSPLKPYRLSAYVDLKRSLLVVNTVSAKQVDDLVAKLRETLGTFKAQPLFAWGMQMRLTRLLESGHEDDFIVGEDCELVTGDADGGVVRLKRHNLAAQSVKVSLRDGMQVKRVELSRGHLCFDLDTELTVRRLSFVGEVPTAIYEEAEEVFDADFALLTGEVGQLFDALKNKFEIDKEQSE